MAVRNNRKLAQQARRRPLVVTSVPDVLEDLPRPAHAAAAVVDVAPDPVGGRR